MVQKSSSLTSWQLVQNLLIVAALALGSSLTAAIFAEGNYARPQCEAYGRAHQLKYLRFEYPPGPLGQAEIGSSCYCIFSDGSATPVEVDFQTVASNYVTYLLVDFALTPVLTMPIFFILFTVGLVGVYGALGIRLRPGARQG